ncbi:MAG: hypothetical protein AAGD92_06600 [Pseudomonadota bacterium]
MEITIVDADTVRLYAKEKLPSAEKTLVEETLLDDDRARALVEEEVDEDASNLLSGKARNKAKKALLACPQSVACYEMLANVDGPPTVQQFAQSQFSKRWALLSEIREALPAEDRSAIQSLRTPVPNIHKAEKAVKEATMQDAHLLDRLHDAFWEKACPLWKARIAKRIAEIHDDKARISWLTNAFA